MTTYDSALAKLSKDLIVVWDFIDPELTSNARFMTRVRPAAQQDTDNDIPDGYILFAGALALADAGSKLDVSTGGLSIGEARFQCGDVIASDGSTNLAQWIGENDRFLNGCKVERRQGFGDVSDVDTWRLTTWALENFRMTRRSGFEFVLVNIVGKITAGVYEDFEGERFELPVGGSDLATVATTITLEESPKNVWREPGQAILYSEDAQRFELVSYETIGGTGDKDLQTVVRGISGVGHPLRTFPNPGTSIYHAWSKRGNPISVLLEWLMTTGYVNEGATQRITNANLDSWADPADVNNWSDINVVEETTIVHTPGGSSAKHDLHLGFTIMTTDSGDRFQLDANKAGAYDFWVYCVSDPLITECVISSRIKNVTNSLNWNRETGTWDAGGVNNLHAPITVFDKWVHVFVAFHTIDVLFDDADDYEMGISGGSTPNTVFYVDDVVMMSPYSAQPNGPYDVGGGDGLGLVAAQLDIQKFEDIRDEFFPEPVFNGTTGDKTSGTAVLFVGRDPIDDLKIFVEQAIFRAFALYPVVDSTERLSCELYFRVSTALTLIDDEWDKSAFRPNVWRREYLKRINNLSVDSDWNSEENEYGRKKQISQATSVERFGKSKLVHITSPGGRNALHGFPDYQSSADLATAANRIMLDLANPGVDMTINAFYKHKDIGLVELVRMNIPGVIDLRLKKIGMVGRFLVVTQRKVDDSRGRVTLSVRERRPVVRPAVVGPNTVASTYTAADDIDRQFCYLTPDNDDEFANGDPSYTIVA